MGYQPGKGLGRALQGRSLPVEAQVRKGRGAVGMTELIFISYIIINFFDGKCYKTVQWKCFIILGLYGAENKGESSKVLSDEEEGKMFKEKLAHWKRGMC